MTFNYRFIIVAAACMSICTGAAAQERLEEAVVTGTRASLKTPVSHTNIKVEEIKSGDVATDLPFMMEMLPSTVSTSESGLSLGNTSFRIRGTDASRTNITLDGIPLNDGESQAVFWANMPALTSFLSSVQIQRGVGTSAAGSGAFGANVNMQTRRTSDKSYVSADFTAGSFATLVAGVEAGTGFIPAGKGHFSFDARFTKVNTDGYIDRSAANHRSLYMTAIWRNSSTLLRASILHGEQHTGLSWNGVPGYAIDDARYAYYEAGVPGYKPAGVNRRYNPAGEYRDDNGVIQYYDNQTDNYNQTHCILQASHILGEHWTLNGGLFLTRGIGYYEEYKLRASFSKYGLPPFSIKDTTISKSDLVRQKYNDNYLYGISISSAYTAGTLRLNFGATATHYDNDHYGKVLWTQFNNARNRNFEWYRNTGVKNEVAAYARANWSVTPAINLYADLQYRNIAYKMTGPDDDLQTLDQSHNFNFLNPKAGVYWQLAPKHATYLSFSVAQREPSRADFKDAMKNGGTRTPEAEKLYDTEIAYKYQDSRLTFGVTGYYMYYRDQLVSTGRLNEVGYLITENVPVSYRAGVELLAGIQLCAPLQFEANMTLSRNKIKDFTAYVDLNDSPDSWNPLPQRIDKLGETDISFSPDVIAAAQLRYEPYKNLVLRLTGKYVGKQFYDNTSSADRLLDDYFTAGFRAAYSIAAGRTNIGIQLFVNNLLNAQYISNAFVYRAAFADGSPDYVENGFFPQAGRNFAVKLTIGF